jgi:hypothetical protein
MTAPAEPGSGFSASLCTRGIAGMRAWAEAKALLQSAQVTR